MADAEHVFAAFSNTDREEDYRQDRVKGPVTLASFSLRRNLWEVGSGVDMVGLQALPGAAGDLSVLLKKTQPIARKPDSPYSLQEHTILRRATQSIVRGSLSQGSSRRVRGKTDVTVRQATRSCSQRRRSSSFATI